MTGLVRGELIRAITGIVDTLEQGTCYGLDRVQVLSIYLSCEVGTVIEPILQPGKQRLSKLAQGPLAPKAGIRI